MTDGLRDITQSCSITIKSDGRWYYEKNEIINPNVLASFQEALEIDSEGRYRIVIPPEVCYVNVEDAPFVVSAIRGDNDHGIIVILNTLEPVELDPTQMRIGGDNSFYMKLDGGMEAKFTRSAYYTLALMMEEDSNGGVKLRIKDRVYPIC